MREQQTATYFVSDKFSNFNIGSCYVNAEILILNKKW